MVRVVCGVPPDAPTDGSRPAVHKNRGPVRPALCLWNGCYQPPPELPLPLLLLADSVDAMLGVATVHLPNKPSPAAWPGDVSPLYV